MSVYVLLVIAGLQIPFPGASASGLEELGFRRKPNLASEDIATSSFKMTVESKKFGVVKITATARGQTITGAILYFVNPKQPIGGLREGMSDCREIDDIVSTCTFVSGSVTHVAVCGERRMLVAGASETAASMRQLCYHVGGD